MNSFQIIMLGIVAVLMVSVFWDKILELVSSFQPTEPKIDSPDELIIDQLVEVSSSKDSTLVDIIRCWEQLKVGCDKANLKEACSELDKIFPLFVVKNTKGVKDV